ncbi:MAG: branched-chain amino acid aminotransferase [Candidatus Abyssobacteria bacterium SURF_5]|uniref:branched-chain-amino-acid transaminase n=1 Tax=Abyssobacteria bacterium (strain SURF_5) TaxID=2093360 RepID=A0A3A4NC11_ABYX5|nr:MAG: branched-chain amino acid aminotransferase [Candidatus Abyssubacteria bacterium SURF_5]
MPETEVEKVVYLDGDFLPEGKALVSVFDRGFLYGDGVFETMRAYGGRVFRLAQHLRRLEESAELIKITPPLSQDQFAKICSDLIERNNTADAIVRISVTRGKASGGLGTSNAGRPTVAAFIRPPMPVSTEAASEGVPAIISSFRKMPSAALNARIKSMNFLNSILARSEAEEAGCYEAVLLDSDGNVTEATTANIFFVGGGRLFTPGPESDILLGITRAAVLELSAEMGIPAEQRKISASELGGFEECFITNSAIEALAVTRIGPLRVGGGKPGAIYKRIHGAYRELVLRNT